MEEAKHKHKPETVSESEWQEMKGIAILAQQSGFPRIQADPQHVIDLIDQRAALLAALQAEQEWREREATGAIDPEWDYERMVGDKRRAAIKSATGGQ